jgi:Lrp/AsnC family leucine-responsive transcriptional regulator
MQKNTATILDQTDLKILDILQREARLDVKQIAARVHKSPAAAQERIRKLQEKGYIQRYIAVLDRKLMGRPTLMITLVKLNRHAAQTLRDFPNYMYSLPEVQVCLHLSGEFDFLLQVTLKDPQEYEAFLTRQLCALPMVEKVQSSLVLKECKSQAALPLLLR